MEEDFSVSPGSIKLKLSLGESGERALVIGNTGSAALTIPLAVEGVQEYLTLSDRFVSTGAGESAAVTLSFIGKRVGFIGNDRLFPVFEMFKDFAHTWV